MAEAVLLPAALPAKRSRFPRSSQAPVSRNTAQLRTMMLMDSFVPLANSQPLLSSRSTF